MKKNKQTSNHHQFEKLYNCNTKSLSSFVWFYGKSTLVGYLMPNPVYIYIKYMVCENIFKQARAHVLCTVKWFQVLLYNGYYSASVNCLHTVCR